MHTTLSIAAALSLAATCFGQTSGFETIVLVRVAHGFQDETAVEGVSANGSAGLYWVSITPASQPANDPPCQEDTTTKLISAVAPSWGMAEAAWGAARMASQTIQNPSFANPNFISSKTEHATMIQATVCPRATPPAIFQNQVISGGKARYTANYNILRTTTVVTNVLVQQQTHFQDGCEKIRCNPLNAESEIDRSIPAQRIDACRILVGNTGSIVGVVTGNNSASYFGVNGTFQYGDDGRLLFSAGESDSTNSVTAGPMAFTVETLGVSGELHGDANGDSLVTFCDLMRLRTLTLSGAQGASSSSYMLELDLNLDGTLDTLDDVLLRAKLPRLDGDLTGDFYINTQDLTRMLSNFGASPATYEMGDINGDNAVNTIDLATMMARFGQGTPSNHPECN